MIFVYYSNIFFMKYFFFKLAPYHTVLYMLCVFIEIGTVPYCTCYVFFNRNWYRIILYMLYVAQSGSGLFLNFLLILIGLGRNSDKFF
jgi:hypothetical protein